MIAAEVRSLYFGELDARYRKTKQIIFGLAFFLSSGAAASMVAKFPSEIPIGMSVLAALATAYAIAVGLDKKATTIAKPHGTWSRLSQIAGSCGTTGTKMRLRVH